MTTLLLSLFLLFQSHPIEGKWVTIDDETGIEKSEIVLYIEDGKLYGKIERLLLPEDQGKRCMACKGDRYNQPIEGLLIVEGLKKDGDS